MKMRQLSIEELNRSVPNTIMEVLGIQFTASTEDSIEATMPVDRRTHQVYGLLHGGASVVLAETLGSVGAMLCVDPEKFRCVGIDINANHMRGVMSGTVTGRANPIHVGRSTQVWNIEIRNEKGDLVCVSRLTVAVVPAQP